MAFGPSFFLEFQVQAETKQPAYTSQPIAISLEQGKMTQANAGATANVSSESAQVSTNEVKGKSIVEVLSENSEKIATEIQRGCRTAFPGTAVQVEIAFSEGSFVALGTAFVLFLQPIVEEATKKALQNT